MHYSKLENAVQTEATTISTTVHLKAAVWSSALLSKIKCVLEQALLSLCLVLIGMRAA